MPTQPDPPITDARTATGTPPDRYDDSDWQDRYDEPGPVEVLAEVDETGGQTVVRITGAGAGRHTATLRLWPEPVEEVVDVEFDGASGLHVVLAGTKERGVANLDGGDELRFDVTPLENG